MGRGKRGDFGKKNVRGDLGAGSAAVSARTIVKPPPVYYMYTLGSFGKNQLPSNPSQMQHIFRDEEGHLPDTPKNRALMLKLINDPSKLAGITVTVSKSKRLKQTFTTYIEWYEDITSDGQYWAAACRGHLINGGLNKTKIQPFDPETGFYANPNK